MHPYRESLDASWNGLYKIGAIAALISAAIVPIQIVVFIVWPPPSSVVEWFALFRENRLVALIDLDLLLVVDNVLLVPIFLALYRLLRRASESLIAIAIAFAFIGIAMFIATNPALEMLSLSQQYAAATAGEQ
jgi:hypothetical protein